MPQALTDWEGDVESLLTEMKRRAGVETDTDLAAALGTSQSNVSTWRKRGSVPNSVLLRFERLNFDGDAYPAHRLLAARTIAIRLAEFAHERAGGRGGDSRLIFYSTVATAWDIIVQAIVADLAKREAATKRWPLDLASELIASDEYLEGVLEWVKSMSATEVLASLSSLKLPQ